LKNKEDLVGAVGIEPSVLLQTRNLFVPRSDESDKNARNDELRYKKGTKGNRLGGEKIANEPTHARIKSSPENKRRQLFVEELRIL
jgi:hypothetical protein